MKTLRSIAGLAGLAAIGALWGLPASADTCGVADCAHQFHDKWPGRDFYRPYIPDEHQNNNGASNWNRKLGDADNDDDDMPVAQPTGATSVPEPGTLGLMGLGLAGIGLARRRRKK